MKKPCKITVASGKGGTGKTTLAVSLFRKMQETPGRKVQLIDCDVEEPNDLIFLPGSVQLTETTVNQQIPEIDTQKCTFCRKCADICEFNAIVIIPPAGFAEVNPSLCHSCGACLWVCDEDAILEYPGEIGKLNTYRVQGAGILTEGRLKIGSAMQTMLIKELKKQIQTDADLIFMDAPPGTSCPVVATMSDSDYVVLVAEPTPFGLHDLKLMVGLVRELGMPFGTVINKAGMGDREIYDYLDQEGIEMLGEIPFSREFASMYASGNLMDEIPENIGRSLDSILNKLTEQLCERIGHFEPTVAQNELDRSEQE